MAPLPHHHFLTGLEEDKAGVLSNKWEQTFVSMSDSMVTRTLSVNELVDMEWKFGGMYIVVVG
jgi:hypothetical protein